MTQSSGGGLSPTLHQTETRGRLTLDACNVSLKHGFYMGLTNFVVVAGACTVLATLLWWQSHGYHWSLMIVWLLVLPPVTAMLGFRSSYLRAVDWATVDNFRERWQWQPPEPQRVETVTETKNYLTVHLVHENGGRFAHFPYEVELFEALANAVIIAGVPLSRPKLCPAVPGLTEAKFSRIQAWLLSEGLAEWQNETNHRQGIRLTDIGRDVLSKTVQGEVKQLTD